VSSCHFILPHEAAAAFELGTADSIELTFDALCDHIINLKGKKRRETIIKASKQISKPLRGYI
jgi:hypothetical protein